MRSRNISFTLNFVISIDQYLSHFCTNQDFSTILLDDWDYIKSNLTGTSNRVVSSMHVMLQQDSLHRKWRFTWLRSWKNMNFFNFKELWHTIPTKTTDFKDLRAATGNLWLSNLQKIIDYKILVNLPTIIVYVKWMCM